MEWHKKGARAFLKNISDQMVIIILMAMDTVTEEIKSKRKLKREKFKMKSAKCKSQIEK